MKLGSISFKPIAHVSFDLLEIEFLMKCSEIHYDSVCIHAGKNGGFLYGIKNMHCFSIKNSLTFREIDTLAKISEVGFNLHGRDGALAMDINSSLLKILRTLNQEIPDEKKMP